MHNDRLILIYFHIVLEYHIVTLDLKVVYNGYYISCIILLEILL